MIRLLASLAPPVSSTFGPRSLSAADALDMVGSLNVDDLLDTGCSLDMVGSSDAAGVLDVAGALDPEGRRTGDAVFEVTVAEEDLAKLAEVNSVERVASVDCSDP